MEKTENELLKDIIALLREIIKAQGGTGKCSSYWVETQMRKLEDIDKKTEIMKKKLSELSIPELKAFKDYFSEQSNIYEANDKLQEAGEWWRKALIMERELDNRIEKIDLES